MSETLWDDHTITGHNHPQTSHDAAARVLPRTGTQRRAVFDAIARYSSGAWGGLTDNEITDVARIAPNSVRPRRVELARAGLIRKAGFTRKNAAGNDCDVWVAA